MVVTMSLITVLLAASVFITANVGHVCAQSLSNDVSDADDSQSVHVSNSQPDNPLLSVLTRGTGHRLNSRDMDNVRDAINSGNWDRFTPAPVTEPNCHVNVEVKVVQRVPGRCIRLGNGIPACQAEKWLSLTTDECS